MRRAGLFVSLALLATALVFGTAGAEVDRTDSGNETDPTIVAVAPNPVVTGDRGEHVVISFPAPTSLDDWTIDDGETTVGLPNRTVSGRVAFATDPGAVRSRDPVLGIDGRLALANAGEVLELRRGNETVSRVTYENAPDGERYVRREEGWTWRPAGASDFPVRSTTNADVRAFVFPDSPRPVLERLARARERVLLAGYTFESRRIVEALCRLRERQVTVEVLLEREPVGGLTTRAADRLDALVRCGIPVSLLGGDHARYSFHHAKYAVVDDAALVLSENWKPSGIGGRSNRGWGALIEDANFAGALAAVFETDRSWRDAEAWQELETDPVEPRAPPANGSFPRRFDPRSLEADRVELIVAPDNAEDAVVGLIESAEKSIAVQQVAIGSRDHPFVNATLRAARRGVRVRVLLSQADYAVRENLAMVEWLNGVAAAEGLPLQARLVEPRSRYGKVHVKGVIVDDAVLVGSLNWNAHATRENREVAAVLHGTVVADYYRRVFRADWRGGVWRLPVGAVGVLVLGVIACIAAGRRMRFEPQSARSP